MDFFAIAEQRSTIRNFEQEPLDEESKSLMLEKTKNLYYLPNAKPVNWKIEQDQKALARFFAYVHEDNIFSTIEYGFEGEQLVIDLVRNGYGTMWMALGAEDDIPAYIRFGKPKAENLKTRFVKTIVKSDRRRLLSSFIDCEENQLTNLQKSILQSMIDAPSSMNRQPWRFSILSENSLTVEATETKRLSFIDLGIVLAHGALAFTQAFGSYSIRKREAVVWELSV
jgi:nitroreductase